MFDKIYIPSFRGRGTRQFFFDDTTTTEDIVKAVERAIKAGYEFERIMRPGEQIHKAAHFINDQKSCLFFRSRPKIRHILARIQGKIFDRFPEIRKRARPLFVF